VSLTAKVSSLAKRIVTRLNNSCQIRVPTTRNSARSPRRRLLITFAGKLFRFNYVTPEDANRIIGFHTKEPLTIRMLKLIEPGDVLLDVGASMGVYSIPAAYSVGSTGRVVAVDADESKIARLRGNARLNGVFDRVETVVALADERSVPELGLLSLDDLFLSHQQPEPTLIKIDVDGPELQVIRGLQSTLRSNRRLRLLQIELCESNRELVDYLGDLSFKMVAFETHASRDVALLGGATAVGNAWFVRCGARS